MRWRSFALSGALSILCWTALPEPSSAQKACADPRRVVGGKDADIKDHPWQVALQFVDGSVCGGVIVGENWVLTAAHCFDTDDPKEVKVKAGATNYVGGGIWSSVDRVVRHKFDPKTNENDLALVKLRSRPPGQPIKLAEPELKLQHCQELTVTGWGRTKADKGGASAKLQMAIVPYVDSKLCNEPNSYNGTVRPSMMCAGFHQVDACKGDSGGPLVLGSNKDKNAVLVGVVSWGEGCGKQLKYGVYTRVSAHHDWITGVIASDVK